MTHAFPGRRLSRVVAPAAEPLTLSETKTYLRVDTSDEDGLITGLIAAARDAAEHYLNRSLITQSWALTYDSALPPALLLPRGPVNSITAIRSLDASGTATAIDPSLYALDASRTGIGLRAAVTGAQAQVEYAAGYGATGANVPAPIRYGMLAHVAALYEARGEGEAIPTQALSLYAPFREVRV